MRSRYVQVSYMLRPKKRLRSLQAMQSTLPALTSSMRRSNPRLPSKVVPVRPLSAYTPTNSMSSRCPSTSFT